MKYKLLSQGRPNTQTLADTIAHNIPSHAFDRLDVAVAYATRSGIEELREVLGGTIPKSRWVIGLDDAITEPQAISFLMGLQDTSIRLAALYPKKRFHPKIYCIWSSENKELCSSIVGSANMTKRGFQKNAESAVMLTAENEIEAAEMRAQWEYMWSLGTDSSQSLIDDYKNVRKEARKQSTPRIIRPAMVINATATTPQNAQIAWTEAATPSAGGRDLEFPKLMMQFFSLNVSPSTKRFSMSNGSVFDLDFTERTDNQMWRLLFTSPSIQAAIKRDTMRPITGGTRSDIAVIFAKSKSNTIDYDVEMVKINSPYHKQIMAQSRRENGLHRTRNPGGRHYGFLK